MQSGCTQCRQSMLQISSFLIAPPSLLLLCMYPLPLPNTAMLCPAMPSPCYAFLCYALAVCCPAMLCPCCALSRQADLCNAFALPCKGKFSSLRFGNRYISPFFPRLTQPVGQTFARQNQTAQPLLKLCLCLAVQCFPSQCLRHVFLGFAMPLHCASKPCLCCALLLKAMPLLC